VLLGFALLLCVREAIRNGAPPAYRNNAFGLLVALFDHPEQLGWPGLLLLIHAPAAALYAVESASAHLQLGVSRIFGVRGSENFRYPFLSTSPGEIWRRWNITLSFWLRDYAFLPLCRWRSLRYAALVLTFIYGGLLHGLYWRHVYWGLYTGGTLALVAWALQRRRAAPRPPRSRLMRAFATNGARLLTIHWACWSVLIFLDPHHCGWRVFQRFVALLTAPFR
jgi:D-alanyl-lipoteichoic acid acyltransferase DltB (MBOAT superfamily)